MAIIEEVKDFAGNVKDNIGNKGFYLLLGGAAIFGLYKLLKADSGSDADLVPATGYAGYPDVGENANVVIDSVNKSILASQDEVIGAIGDHDDNITDRLEDVKNTVIDTSEATNNYIQEGIDSVTDLNEKVDQVADASASWASGSGVSAGMGAAASAVEAAKKNTTSSTAKSPAKSTAKSNTSGSNTIQYTTKKGLNTSTSIVDALKAAGQDSSFESRAELYYANGGTGTYTGSSKQNVSMLNKLKEGDLKKA